MSDEELNKARKEVDAWYLGKTSTRFETGGKGVTTINPGSGDHGGASYGAYQLSRNAGTLGKYMEQSAYGRHFDGLTPGTREFNDKWREVGASEPGFGKEQHDFIARTHYEVELRRLQEMDIDLSDRSRAVQDAVWSTSVQFGPGTRNIFYKGLQERFGENYELSSLADSDIVEAIQDYKTAHNNTLFKSSPKNWPGLLSRAAEEKAELVELATHEQTLAKHNQLSDWQTHQALPDFQSRSTAPGSRDPTVKQLQENLNDLGIRDARSLELQTDGNRGGPASRTNEAIAAFQRQFGLEGNQLSNAELLTATQAALNANPVRHAEHAMRDILPPSLQPQSPAMVNGMPDYLLPGRDAPNQTTPTSQAPQPSQPVLPEDVVRTLQRQLNDLGVRDERGQPLEARSGIYGSHTAAAVRTFQQDQGLPATGVADDATRSTINAHAIVARLQQDKAAREAQTATTPLAPMAPTLETADLHARLHPDHTGPDALRSTYATAAPVVNTVAPRRAADQPDQFGPMQQSTVPVGRQAGEQAPQPAPANAQAALHPGDRGPEVWTLQDSLIRSGVNQNLSNPVQAHGAYDQATQRGVMAFQLQQGLEPTGIADAVTRQTVHQTVRAVEHAQTGPSLTPTDYTASTPPVQQAPAPAPEAPAPEAPTAGVDAHWQQQLAHEQQERMLAQARQEEDKRHEEEPTRQASDPLAAASSQTSKPLSIEDHPALPGIRQALCDKLEQQGQLAGVSDDRLTEIAGQLHQRGLQSDGRWAATIRNETFFAQGQELAKSGVLVKLDLSQPPASPEQTLQEVATFDRQQALDAQAIAEQRQREQDDPGRKPTM